MNKLDRYRIHRTDSRNIAIQEWKGDKKPRWENISYHGNSPSSLASGLLELIMREYTPETDKLAEELKNVQLALVSGKEEIEKMIKEYIK